VEELPNALNIIKHEHMNTYYIGLYTYYIGFGDSIPWNKQPIITSKLIREISIV